MAELTSRNVGTNHRQHNLSEPRARIVDALRAPLTRSL